MDTPRTPPRQQAGVRIVPLDARDATAMRAWQAIFVASSRHQRPWATPRVLEEMQAMFTADLPHETNLAFSGLVDGAVACVGMLYLPLHDNLSQAYVEVHTHPAVRGRGVGGTMLEHLERLAAGHDRSTLLTEAAFPYDGPADGAGHPDVEFLRRRGYTFALGNVQRVLDLPADEAPLHRLADEAAPYHRDYTLRQFTGLPPEDLIASFAAIVGTLMTEAPTGEVAREVERFDADRIRADQAVFDESGRTKYTTVALDRDGQVAAYSELVVPRFEPGRVYQWGTLARPRDRGHRLGVATKVHNLLWAQRHLEGPAGLVTFNADVNRHMIGINEQMGFRPVERVGEFQKRR